MQEKENNYHGENSTKHNCKTNRDIDENRKCQLDFDFLVFLHMSKFMKVYTI